LLFQLHSVVDVVKIKSNMSYCPNTNTEIQSMIRKNYRPIHAIQQRLGTLYFRDENDDINANKMNPHSTFSLNIHYDLCILASFGQSRVYRINFYTTCD